MIWYYEFASQFIYMCCYKTFFSTVGSDFDFRATIFTVTFAAGIENVLVHIQIPIVDDMNAEEAETFTAKLTSTDQSVQIINDTATVNIFDDDGEARVLDKPLNLMFNTCYFLFLQCQSWKYIWSTSHHESLPALLRLSLWSMDQ